MKCPKCGSEMQDGATVWWCMNPDCDMAKKLKEMRCQDCQHEPDFGEPLSRDGKDWCYDCGFYHFKPREAGQKGDG